MNKNKKGIRKFSARFLAFSNKISTVQKIVLSSSRGQGNFHGLDLRGQGQGHENVSSRTPPLTNSSVKPSSWSEVLLLSKSFTNLSNKQKEVTFKLAHFGYFFGKFNSGTVSIVLQMEKNELTHVTSAQAWMILSNTFAMIARSLVWFFCDYKISSGT